MEAAYGPKGSKSGPLTELAVLAEGQNLERTGLRCTADNGGLRIALMAYVTRTAGQPPQTLDGFTPEQRVFLGWGQVWCSNVRPERSRMLAHIDPHSPGHDRVNGLVSNMPEFRQAFQ
mgnify:CR=1 FL=1